MKHSKLIYFGLFAFMAGVQFAAAFFSPWLALGTAIVFGLVSGPVAGLFGLGEGNPWIIVGLTMGACLVGVLAAAPIAVAEPQGVAAISPSAALFAGIGRVLIGQARKK